jgi:hypothetical protein
LPDRYRIGVDFSDSSSHRFICRACADIASGETGRFEIDLDSELVTVRTPVRGSLFCDASWGSADFAPQLQWWRFDPSNGRCSPVGAVAARQRAERSYEWDAGRLQVGRYVVAVEPLGFAKLVDIVANDAPIRIEVPAKQSCRVRFIGALDGRAITPPSIQWWPQPAGWSGALQPQWLLPTTDNAAFQFDAARGAVAIASGVDDAGPRKLRLELPLDALDSTIALLPDCRLRVQLRDGSRTVAFPNTATLRLTYLDGNAQLERRSLSGDELLVSLETPGRYLLSLRAVAGYPLPAPIRVDARNGAELTVVFELKK